MDLFGDITIEQLYKKRGIAICIPSVAILREKSRVFKTPHNPKKQLDNKYSLVDICLATSAAPIFLPLVALDWPSDQKSFDVFADGGLWANNPILIGILEALDQCDVKRPIQVISIGTCTAPEGNILDKNEINRGLLGWRVGAKALSLSMNAQASGANFMAQFLQNQLQKLGKNIEVVRIPEAPPSEDQIKYLRLDLASTKALEAFKALGRDDGINAYRLCQDNSNKHGIIISEIFNSMPVLNQKT